MAVVTDESDHAALVVARILGCRHALQGLVEVTTWPRWHKTGAMVDAAHALTAVGLAVIDARWRRVALADSVVAASFGLGGRQPVR